MAVVRDYYSPTSGAHIIIRDDSVERDPEKVRAIIDRVVAIETEVMLRKAMEKNERNMVRRTHD